MTKEATIYAPGLTVETIARDPVPPIPQPGAAPTIYPFRTPRQPMLTLLDQWASGQYERYIRELVVTSNPATLDFHKVDPVGGAEYALSAPVYRLADVRSGAVVAIYTTSPGTKRGRFVAQFPITSGHADLAIQACDAAGNPDPSIPEDNVPFAITLDLDGNAKHLQTVASQRSTFDWTRMPAHAIVVRPKADFTPVPQPYVPSGAVVPFTSALSASKMFRYILTGAPGEANAMTPHHLCTMRSGVQHTSCMQGYFPRDMYTASTELPMLRGERNVATAYMWLYLRAARKGKWYAHTPNAWVVVLADGRVVTLWGKEHIYAPDHREHTHGGPEERIVGKCIDSRVPASEAYPRNAWGGDFDHDSLNLDLTATPIDGEQPHGHDEGGVIVAWVYYFLTDERGWVWRVRRNGADPNRAHDPSTWQESEAELWITGLNLPRGLAHRLGTRELLVGEAGRHRIGRWSMDKPDTYLGPWIENPNANNFGKYETVAQTDANGHPRMWLGADPRSAAVQAEPIIAPEGIAYYRDLAGAEWVIWVSRAQMDIRRCNASGNVQKIGNLSYSASASPGHHVTQVCVNDNTLDADGNMPRGGFGPHGAVFAVTFYNAEFGRPQAFVPNAAGGYSPWSLGGYAYDVIAGRGPNWSNDVYPTACAVGYGQMGQCTSLNALYVTRQATNADPAPDYARLTRGHNYYKSKAYDLLGPYGYTPNGWRPWGENADCDYWMQYNGHTP